MDWYQELLQTPAPPAEPRADRPDVTASDVAGYMFCGRAWWLRRWNGMPAEAAPALKDGEHRHALADRTAVQGQMDHPLRVIRWTVIVGAACALLAIAMLAR
jgi:hypothetical protein